MIHSSGSKAPTSRVPSDFGALTEPDSLSESEYEFIRNLVYEHSRIHLGGDKKVLVSSRLSKRLRKLDLATLRQGDDKAIGVVGRWNIVEDDGKRARLNYFTPSGAMSSHYLIWDADGFRFQSSRTAEGVPINLSGGRRACRARRFAAQWAEANRSDGVAAQYARANCVMPTGTTPAARVAKWQTQGA